MIGWVVVLAILAAAAAGFALASKRNDAWIAAAVLGIGAVVVYVAKN